jgi:hypothetical protein
VYVVWSSPSQKGVATGVKQLDLQGVFLSYSLDGGSHWSPAKLISDPTKDARLPWIAAGLPGRVAITWYQNTLGLQGTDYLPDVWDVELWESVTADQPQPVSQLVTLASQSHIGSICTSGTGCEAGGDRTLYDFFEVALDTAGQPVAAWASSNLGQGEVSVDPVLQAYTFFGGVTGGTPLK